MYGVCVYASMLVGVCAHVNICLPVHVCMLCVYVCVPSELSHSACLQHTLPYMSRNGRTDVGNILFSATTATVLLIEGADKREERH